MIALFFFGPLVEQALGRWKFLWFYLLCGCAGPCGMILLGKLHLLQVDAESTLVGAFGGDFRHHRGRGEDRARSASGDLSLFLPPADAIGHDGVALHRHGGVHGSDSRANAGGQAAHLGGAAVGFILIRLPGMLRRPAPGINSGGRGRIIFCGMSLNSDIALFSGRGLPRVGNANRRSHLGASPAAKLADLPIPGDDPFVGRQIRRPHRAAGVEFVGADADLGAQAIFAAVGESGAGVDHHAGGIDAGDELLDRRGGIAQDRIGVMAAVFVDVRRSPRPSNRRLSPRRSGSDIPAANPIRRPAWPWDKSAGALVAADFHALGRQIVADLGPATSRRRLCGTAFSPPRCRPRRRDSWSWRSRRSPAPCFHRFRRHRVHINVAVAGEMFQHGNGRFCRPPRGSGSRRRGESPGRCIDPASAAGGRARDRSIRSTARRPDRCRLAASDLAMMSGDGAVGMQRFFSAAQDDGVAALEAQRGRIAGDVGPALVKKQHDAQRHAHFLIRSPLGRTYPSMICPTGSTCAAICSTPSAMAAMRLSLSLSRSTSGWAIVRSWRRRRPLALAASNVSCPARMARGDVAQRGGFYVTAKPGQLPRCPPGGFAEVRHILLKSSIESDFSS